LSRPPDKGGASEASGGFAGFSKRLLNPPAHRFKLLHHFYIGEAQNAQRTGPQSRRPDGVVTFGVVREMRVAVQLDHELLFGTVKIGDVGAERLLTTELLPMEAKELVPEFALRGRLITAQFAGAGL